MDQHNNDTRQHIHVLWTSEKNTWQYNILNYCFFKLPIKYYMIFIFIIVYQTLSTGQCQKHCLVADVVTEGYRWWLWWYHKTTMRCYWWRLMVSVYPVSLPHPTWTHSNKHSTTVMKWPLGGHIICPSISYLFIMTIDVKTKINS